MKKIFFILPLIFITLITFSQQRNEFKQVDDFVEKLGSLDGHNVATIADTLTRSLTDNLKKCRAIYYWITHHISLDLKATKANDNRNIDPVTVINTRKATPLGYATLFQEMCSMANIRCLTVDGFIRKSVDDINNPVDEINHSWAVVQLGQTPTEWYYVDVAKGSGITDKQLKTFTPFFTSEYFFAEKTLFNLDHFPDNLAWQLGPGPKTLKDFFKLPVISNAAYKLGVSEIKPLTGYLKTKTKSPVSFSFKTTENEISSVSLIMGEEKRSPKPEPMNFTNSGTISFSYQFKKEDTFPLKIMVDGQVVLEFIVEATE